MMTMMIIVIIIVVTVLNLLKLFSALTDSKTVITMDEDKKERKKNTSNAQGLSFVRKNLLNQNSFGFLVIFSLIRALIFIREKS